VKHNDYNRASMDHINIYKDKFSTRRNINPLDPIYEIKNKNENFIYGQIEKSKPVCSLPYTITDPKNLSNADIDGTQVGSKNIFQKYCSTNTNLINSDIFGSNHGSLIKGLTTNRRINPLNPAYVFPGHMKTPLEYKSQIFSNTNSKIKEIERKVKGMVENKEGNFCLRNSSPNDNNNQMKNSNSSENLVNIESTPLLNNNKVKTLSNRMIWNNDSNNPKNHNFGITRDKYIIPGERLLHKSRLCEFYEKNIIKHNKSSKNAFNKITNSTGALLPSIEQKLDKLIENIH